MRDVHILELARAIDVDLTKDIHLLYPIEGFVRQKEIEKDPWQYRVKSDGRV